MGPFRISGIILFSVIKKSKNSNIKIFQIKQKIFKCERKKTIYMWEGTDGDGKLVITFLVTWQFFDVLMPFLKSF